LATSGSPTFRVERFAKGPLTRLRCFLLKDKKRATAPLTGSIERRKFEVTSE